MSPVEVTTVLQWMAAILSTASVAILMFVLNRISQLSGELARMGQNVAKLEGRFETFSTVEIRVDRRIDEINNRLSKIEDRLTHPNGG